MITRRIFPKAKGLFITGTDTGVGKTLITGALAHLAVSHGISTGVFKPVATGCELVDDLLQSEDARFLSYCVNGGQTEQEISPVCYGSPVSPMTAVEQTGTLIDWASIVSAYRKTVDNHELVFVEGIGGVMVPFSENDFVLDLMVDLALPVLVVARASLGTLNQSILTVKACQSRGLSVFGILLNESVDSGSDESRKTNCQDLARLAGIVNVSVITFCKGSCVKDKSLGKDVLSQLTQTQWIKELIHI